MGAQTRRCDVNLEDIADLDDFWQERGDAPYEAPRRAGPPEPDAPAAAAYREVFVRETPAERAARLERQRPEYEAAMARIRDLTVGRDMPGGETRRGHAPRVEDPGQGERVRRQMAELRRKGLYDGPVSSGG